MFFQFLIFKSGPDKFFFKTTIFVLKFFEILFLSVPGYLGRDSVSFLFNFGFSLSDRGGNGHGKLFIGTNDFGLSVFGSVSFEEVLSLEYLFPELIFIKIVC